MGAGGVRGGVSKSKLLQAVMSESASTHVGLAQWSMALPLAALPSAMGSAPSHLGLTGQNRRSTTEHQGAGRFSARRG